VDALCGHVTLVSISGTNLKHANLSFALLHETTYKYKKLLAGDLVLQKAADADGLRDAVTLSHHRPAHKAGR